MIKKVMLLMFAICSMTFATMYPSVKYNEYGEEYADGYYFKTSNFMITIDGRLAMISNYGIKEGMIVKKAAFKFYLDNGETKTIRMNSDDFDTTYGCISIEDKDIINEMLKLIAESSAIKVSYSFVIRGLSVDNYRRFRIGIVVGDDKKLLSEYTGDPMYVIEHDKYMDRENKEMLIEYFKDKQ